MIKKTAFATKTKPKLTTVTLVYRLSGSHPEHPAANVGTTSEIVRIRTMYGYINTTMKARNPHKDVRYRKQTNVRI